MYVDYDEKFRLPDKYIIELNYLRPFENEGKKQYARKVQNRTSADCVEKIIWKNNIKIYDKIEKNVHKLEYKDIRKLKLEGKPEDFELERTVNFGNEFTLKIEYWHSKDKQEPNQGNLDSEYRRLILFNSEENILSEIIEKNPNYIGPNFIYEDNDAEENIDSHEFTDEKLAKFICEIHNCANRYNEAEYQREYGDINEAIKLHKSNVESDVDYSASYMRLAEIYHELNDIENEILILEKGIAECDDVNQIEEMKYKLKKLEKINSK